MTSRLKNKLKTWRAFRHRTAYNAWHSLRPRYHVMIGGRPVLIPGKTPDALGLVLEWRPDWKTRLIHEVLTLRAGKFIDIGANIGQTLLDYLGSPRRCGYVGFEPNSRCLELLSEIIRINDLEDCLIMPVGLSGENSVKKFFTSKELHADSGASIVRGLRPQKECRTQLVPCYRFDDVRDVCDLDAIALIKIDVEGAESFVLGGMTGTLEAFKPWVICEVLLRDPASDAEAHQARSDNLMGTIRRTGYTAMRIGKTPDDSAVRSLTPIDSFPNGVWSSWRDAEHCDYLLVPEADQAQALGHHWGSA